MPLLTITSPIAVASCSSLKRSEHEIGVAVVIDVAGPTLNSSFRLSLEAVSTEGGLSRLPVVALRDILRRRTTSVVNRV
jgi:hypothetical protein